MLILIQYNFLSTTTLEFSSGRMQWYLTWREIILFICQNITHRKYVLTIHIYFNVRGIYLLKRIYHLRYISFSIEIDMTILELINFTLLIKGLVFVSFLLTFMSVMDILPQVENEIFLVFCIAFPLGIILSKTWSLENKKRKNKFFHLVMTFCT